MEEHRVNVRNLPGISSSSRRLSFVAQLIESERRVRYIAAIRDRMRDRPISDRRADPRDSMFDPLKAALLFQQRECLDEAFWMVFIFVHFGKHHRYGWRYARRVYGKLCSTERWDWATISADPSRFSSWLHRHLNEIKNPTAPGGFGNHRKYQSLNPYSSNGTGAAFESYVNWVGPPRTQQQLFDRALQQNDSNPRTAFDDLYRSMNSVASFGRVARFDYLTMVGKLGLAPIEPGSPYLQGSTGPKDGACLLFGEQAGPTTLDKWASELAHSLGVGMQVMEDALCNWQKSPDIFTSFRG